MKQAKIVLYSTESDSFGNIFQVNTPYWEVKKRLEYFDENGVEVTNRKEVEKYLEASNA